MKNMRLDPFVQFWIGSRKEVKAIIKAQRVLVDDKIVKDPDL